MNTGNSRWWLQPNNLLTLFRIASLPFLLWLAIEKMLLPFLALYVFATISDYFDGLVARRLGLASEQGAKLDFIADELMKYSLAICVYFLSPGLFITLAPLLLYLLLLYALSQLIIIIKRKSLEKQILKLYSGYIYYWTTLVLLFFLLLFGVERIRSIWLIAYAAFITLYRAEEVAIKVFLTFDQGTRAFFETPEVQRHANRRRASILEGRIGRHLSGKVLDIGCGNFLLGERLIAKGKDVTGIDVKGRNATGRRIILYDGKRLPFKREFDCSMLVTVLHHASDQEQLLKEAKRVTKRRIIIVEDVCGSSLELIGLYILDYIGNLLSGWTGGIRYRTENEWEDLFRRLKLKVIGKERFRIYSWRPGGHVLYVLEV